jgi:hypothetical protein
MTTEKKTITITMSETAPVKIDPEQWPVIAEACRHDGKVACQANIEWVIRVREHVDGRRLVYGSQSAGSGGKPAGWRSSYAGYLVDVRPQIEGHGSPDDMRRGYAARDKARETETLRAIRRVAGVIGDEQLGAECIGELPAQEI